MMVKNRKRLWHDPPLWVRDNAVFFITICCRLRGVNRLCLPDIGDQVLETVAFRHERQVWYAHLFLLMPDHVHGLLSFPSETAMGEVIKQWKAFNAKALGVQWQRSFFDHRLRSDESLQGKAEYILLNPVRNGLVADPKEWPYAWRPER